MATKSEREAVAARDQVQKDEAVLREEAKAREALRDRDARDGRKSLTPQQQAEEDRREEIKRLQEMEIPVPALSSFRGKPWPAGEYYVVYLNGEQVVDVDEASVSGGAEEGTGWISRIINGVSVVTEGVVMIVKWTGTKVDHALSPSIDKKADRKKADAKLREQSQAPQA